MSNRALILLSGGLDSTVAAYLYRQSAPIALALTFDYGQRAALREIQAAQKICDQLECEHKIIKITLPEPHLAGALINPEVSLPTLESSHLDSHEHIVKSARAVWVPNRNGIMINWAAFIAEAQGIGKMIVGFNIEEAATFPDNSRQFVEAINQSLYFSTANHVEVVSPTLGMSKTEIVQEGMKLGVPFQQIWSCYEGGVKPCGNCESCLRYFRAMANNT